MDETRALFGDSEAFRDACVALGRALADARMNLEMTQEEVARIAHVSPLTVRRVEAGELGPFTLGSIERIAIAVDLPLHFDLVPAVEELVVLAAATDRPVRVYARLPREG